MPKPIDCEWSVVSGARTSPEVLARLRHEKTPQKLDQCPTFGVQFRVQFNVGFFVVKGLANADLFLGLILSTTPNSLS
jgi:hypothetical protein